MIMATHIGQPYKEWAAEQGAKSEARRQSEREAVTRVAREGITNREVRIHATRMAH